MVELEAAQHEEEAEEVKGVEGVGEEGELRCVCFRVRGSVEVFRFRFF